MQETIRSNKKREHRQVYTPLKKPQVFLLAAGFLFSEEPSLKQAQFFVNHVYFKHDDNKYGHLSKIFAFIDVHITSPLYLCESL